jgi:hypothetical protein
MNGDENRYICRLLAGEPEGKRSLGRKDVSGWIMIR